MHEIREIARIFQRRRGEGGGGGGHTQDTYRVHCRCFVLKMEYIYNYLALEKIYGMLILRIHAFSPPELKGLNVVYLINNYLTKGVGSQAAQPLGYTPGNVHTCKQSF